MNLNTGSAGQPEAGVKRTLKLAGLHRSAQGLTANVSYSFETVAREPIPGSQEHLVSRFVFQKQIDLPLATPTEITDVESLKPLDASQPQRQAPVEITVTATAL